MNNVGCLECMSNGIFYRKRLKEWNDRDRMFGKEFTGRSEHMSANAKPVKGKNGGTRNKHLKLGSVFTKNE